MISTIFKGAAMGIAEVIPGVSGGTIAFITGIYERLLECIKAINPSLITIYRSEGLGGVLKAIDAKFLALLFSGMLGGIVVGIFGVTYLLDHYPTPLWGFFFGLILASSIYIARQIPNWNMIRFISLVVGFAIAYGVTMIAPVEGSDSLLMIFVAGVIAISALILPGVSGSFMLLLMGMYTLIIPALKSVIKNQDITSLVIVIVFGLGCIVGLAGFSRVLSWLLDKYKYATFALLTGFMIGSLNKIWPWRNVREILNKETGEIESLFQSSSLLDRSPDSFKILTEQNVLPQAYEMGNALTIITIIALIVGFVSVFILEKTNANAIVDPTES